MAGGEDAADAVVAAAREGEPDRYLAALLAPPAVRPALLALAAFSAELSRIPALVTREPTMGHIRLQWWRDALAGPAGSRTGHPVADALRAAAARHALPGALLEGVIDGREADLSPDPPDDDAALAAYLWKTEGALFALAAGVLAGRAPDAPDAVEPAAVAAGRAYGLARLLLVLPHALARGRLPLPATHLDAAGASVADVRAGRAGPEIRAVLGHFRLEARSAHLTARQDVAKLPRETRAAFLPLALVGSYVRALERAGDPLREPAAVAPLTRVARIAAAHWLGSL